jgi:hypothetical protein
MHLNIKKFLLPVLISLTTQSAIANISIQASPALTTDICGAAQGTWMGGGTVSAGPLSCHYSGTAIVTPATANTIYNYNVTMELTLDAGMCPPNASVTTVAACENNKLTIDSDNIDLTGMVNASGTAADLSGTIYVNISGDRIEATVSNLHMQKQ